MYPLGHYVHNIDPIIGSFLGIHFWWYGLSYTLGFLNAYIFMRRMRSQLGFSMRSVYNLSLLLVCGVLLGGRLIEVLFYEWPFYSEHIQLIPALWLGGMATHGLLFGGLIGILLFCRLHGKSFLRVTDLLSIPAAFILGVGRIGNFIDGQIVGSVTNVSWAVKFPDAEGFRHPVVLYDGMKNLLIIPILIYAGKRQLPPGVLTGIFLFLYAFLRIFVDVFREYPTSLLGLATGQALNILMSILGLILVIVPFVRMHDYTEAINLHRDSEEEKTSSMGVGWRSLFFAFLLIFSMVIPSDWTQDIPARYGKRHAGLKYSAIYPKINASPESTKTKVQLKEVPKQTIKPTR
jgi:phosphatidylglycerol---prolipoprotein diacylglyceryl transferase